MVRLLSSAPSRISRDPKFRRWYETVQSSFTASHDSLRFLCVLKILIAIAPPVSVQTQNSCRVLQKHEGWRGTGGWLRIDLPRAPSWESSRRLSGCREDRIKRVNLLQWRTEDGADFNPLRRLNAPETEENRRRCRCLRRRPQQPSAKRVGCPNHVALESITCSEEQSSNVHRTVMSRVFNRIHECIIDTGRRRANRLGVARSFRKVLSR